MPKSKNVRRTKKNKKQTKLSKILSKSRFENHAHQLYFNELSPNEIYNNLPKIARSAFFRGITHVSYNRSLNSFYNPNAITSNLEKNISWALGIVNLHKDSIQEILNVESLISQYILHDEFEKAASLLDKIDQENGPSMWSLQIRAALEIDAPKLSTDKLSFQSHLEHVRENRFLSFILEHSGAYFKDEEIFFTATKTHLHDIERSVNHYYKTFLIYRIFSHSILYEYDFSTIFNIEINTSPIDLLFLIITFLDHSFFQNDDQELIQRIITTLNQSLSHHTIRNYAAAIGISVEWDINREVIKNLDIALKDNKDQKCRQVNSADDFSSIEYYSKFYSRISSDPGSTIATVFKLTRNIHERNPEYQKSLESLACTAYKYRSLSWFRSLNYFISKESEFTSLELRNVCDKLMMIHSQFDTPKKLKIIHDQLKLNFIDSLRQTSPTSQSLELCESLYQDNSKPLPEKIRNYELYQAKLAIQCEPSKLITNWKELAFDGEDPVLSNEASKMYFDHLIQCRNYEIATDFLVSYFLDKNASITIFDTQKLLDLAYPTAKVSSNIVYIIAYSLHSRFNNPSHDSRLKYLFEVFLTKNNVQFPEELRGKEDQYGKNRLHYFFKWVCTPENMKLYLEFESPRHIQESRLRICNYLMDLGESSPEIQNEVKEINRNIAIKRATERVDNSRIYVDTDIFYGRSSKNFRQLFEHFEKLNKKDYSTYIDELNFDHVISAIRDEKENLGATNLHKIYSSVHFPALRLNSKNATFLSLVKMIREEFTHGEKGLNNHLSTRIRHGVLPTAFRKPVVDEGIYIPKKRTVEEFFSKARLDRSKGKVSYNDLTTAFDILKKASIEYDELTNEINDSWLQVSTMEIDAPKISDTQYNASALFTYETTPLECFALQKELPISPSYEDFIRVTIDWLWERTEINLAKVQEAIKEEALPRAYSILERSKATIKSYEIESSFSSEICNSIDRAKESLRNQVDLIMSWFTHTERDTNEAYDINTAINIAKKSLNIDLKVVQNISVTLIGRSLNYFVDIFFILFENALSKSNLDKDRLEIEIDIRSDADSNLNIRVQNNCNLGANLHQAKNNINFYREAYGQESLINDIVQQEGGTGFFKIWKILRKDIETHHNLDMGFSDDSTFYVDIVLEPSKYVRWHEHINS